MAGFQLSAQDEFPHPPGPERHFNESVYANAFDHRERVGGWMRIGNRVNEGYAELSVCLYLPDGRIACQFQRPAISDNDRFSAGGLSFLTQEPLKRATMTYEGELLLLDDPDMLREPSKLSRARRVPGAVVFDQTTISPVHGGVPVTADQETMYGRDFSYGHFNQHTRVTGSIEVGHEKWLLEGSGWRDHSWGPRLWQNIHFYRLFLGNFGGERGFMLLKITDPAGFTRRVGVLLADGDYEEIRDMDVVTDWTTAQEPARVRLGVRTKKRSAIIDGLVLSLAALRNRRRIDGETIVSRIAEGFTQFTWDGVVGYGMCEYIERLQDGRPVGYPM